MATMTLIDTHVHYNDEDSFEYVDTLLRRMDENDVDKAVLFGVQGDPICSDGAVLHAFEAHPDRLIPFACSIRCELDRDADVFMNSAFRRPWRGVGEIYLDLGGNPGVTYPMRDGTEVFFPHYCPPDKHLNPVYGKVFTECAKHGLPVHVHCQSVETMRAALALFPNTTFIWAHCDHMLVEDDVIQMMDTHPNLYCEVGIQFRFQKDKLLSGQLGPEDQWLPMRFRAWQEAAERHPGRMMWGTDVFVWSDVTDSEAYRGCWEVFGLFCEPLSAQAKAGIAGENLLSLLPG